MKQDSLVSVSIIVPIFRVELYLRECIESLISQTLKDIEIILVDDGSDDGCAQICDQYAERDSRIKVVHKKNGGLDSARKAGIAIASGKYVGYVDGDDWIEPFMYERMVELAEKYQVSVVETGIIDSWDSVESKRHSYLQEGCYKAEIFKKQIEPYILYRGSFFQHGISPYLCTKIFLRKSISRWQNIDDILNKIHDDTMVSIPCIVEAKSIYISHECFYHYRVRTDSGKRAIRQDEVKNFMECYPLMFERFQGSLLGTQGDHQLNSYSMYWLLMKAPYVFVNQAEGRFEAISQLKRNSRIVLYGAGAVGIHWKECFAKAGMNVLCWMDKNYETLSATIDVCNPETISNYEFDYVVIAILRESTVESAKNDLLSWGVPKKKICWIDKQYTCSPELLLQKAVYEGKNVLKEMDYECKKEK